MLRAVAFALRRYNAHARARAMRVIAMVHAPNRYAPRKYTHAMVAVIEGRRTAAISSIAYRYIRRTPRVRRCAARRHNIIMADIYATGYWLPAPANISNEKT